MNDEGHKNTKQESENWKNELWSLINNSDGTNCPLYKLCKYRRNNDYCFSKTEYLEEFFKFLDNDSIIFPPSLKELPEIPTCTAKTKIFNLVIQLAHDYQKKTNLKEIPVPTAINANVYLDQPTEIRFVPLKTTHGAVWQLKPDGWIIYLNSKDSPARRRFTLYHELFHILAHCNGNPIFKKVRSQKEGAFNELLADLFSGVIVLPREVVISKWAELKDIKKIAAIFDVPEPVVYYSLKHMKLI